MSFDTAGRTMMGLTSADMVSFSAPRRLLETEDESIIDLFPMLDAVAPGSGGPRHALVYKAEKNDCKRREWTAGRPVRAADGCTLVLRLARAHNASGPWTPDRSVSGGFFPGALSRPCVEGPAPFRLPRASPNPSWRPGARGPLAPFAPHQNADTSAGKAREGRQKRTLRKPQKH